MIISFLWLFCKFFGLTGFLKRGVLGRKKGHQPASWGETVDDLGKAPPLGAALLFYQISPKKST
jgi:hypothetical protein